MRESTPPGRPAGPKVRWMRESTPPGWPLGRPESEVDGRIAESWQSWQSWWGLVSASVAVGAAEEVALALRA